MKEKVNILTVIIILIIISFTSCQNYESAEYIEMENKAIEDIIFEMTEFEEMKRLNNWGNEKLKLYIVSKLDTSTAWTIKPTGYDVGANGIDYSKKRIEENNREFEESLAKYEKEEKLFKKLKDGTIKTRGLKYNFSNDKIDIELIAPEKIKSLETKQNEFGYLSISRIIFNKNFTKGYLHYSFFCGSGCAWDNNVEISKINGTWKITQKFSGGIA